MNYLLITVANAGTDAAFEGFFNAIKENLWVAVVFALAAVFLVIKVFSGGSK